MPLKTLYDPASVTQGVDPESERRVAIATSNAQSTVDDMGTSSSSLRTIFDPTNLPSQTVDTAGGVTGRFPPRDGGLGTVFGVGTVDLANSLVSAAEMATGSEFLGDKRRELDAVARQWTESLTPDLQQELQREFLTLDSDKSVFTDPGSLVTQFVRQMPNLLATLAPAGIAGKVGAKVGAKLLGAKGAQVGATVGGAGAGAATEGAMVAGFTFKEIADGIEQAPVEILRENPKFQALESDVGEEAARQMMIRDIGAQAGSEAGAVSAALGALGGAIFGKIFGAGVGTKTGKAAGQIALAEGLTEAPQEAYETYRGNLAAQESFDPGRESTAGVAESAVAGGVYGAAGGGVLGGGAQAINRGAAKANLSIPLDQIELKETVRVDEGDGPIDRVVGQRADVVARKQSDKLKMLKALSECLG